MRIAHAIQFLSRKLYKVHLSTIHEHIRLGYKRIFSFIMIYIYIYIYIVDLSVLVVHTASEVIGQPYDDI